MRERERTRHASVAEHRATAIGRIVAATVFAGALATAGMYSLGGTSWGTAASTAQARELASRHASGSTTAASGFGSARSSWSRTRPTTTTTTTAPKVATTTTAPKPTTTTTTTIAPKATTTTAPKAGPQQGAQLTAGDLVYDGAGAAGHFEIFTMHPDGSGVKQLTNDAGYNSWWPRPSPDRTRVLFYRTPAGVPPTTYAQAALWMMNADGTNAHVVLAAGANGWTLQAHAEWSPDGTRIVFMAATTQSLIMTIAPDGSDLRVLGGGPGANVDPAYSPDGRSIVYVGCPTWSCSPTTSEVFRMNADGTGTRTQLTSDGYRDQDPAVSPDGTTVAILTQTVAPSSAEPFGEWQLRTVGIDGGAVHQITSGPALESAPRWSPDGTHLWTHRDAMDDTVWDVTSMDAGGGNVTPIRMPGTQEFPAVA